MAIFVLGNSGVANVDLIFANNSLQNGADAVAVYLGNAADFPNGTAVTAANLVDAVVYENNLPDDRGLIDVLTPGQAQVNESERGAGVTQSLQRVTDGAGGQLKHDCRDFRKTHDNAHARGGVAATVAGERLSPVLTIISSLNAQLEAAQAFAAPLLAALAAADRRADKTIGKVSDDIWNDLGRPATDAALDLLFPGGNAFYVDGDVNEQPDRMDLLVELLKSNVHPKLSAAVTQASIATIAAESVTLRAAVDVARPARAKLDLLDRVLMAVARSSAIEIANFKRMLKAHGFSEADAHTIIPDRSHAPGKTAAVDSAGHARGSSAGQGVGTV